MSQPVKPGARYKCDHCGTEVVVIKPDDVIPSCCGDALQPVVK